MSDDRRPAAHARGDGDPMTTTDDLADFTIEIADQVESFVRRGHARSPPREDPDYAISLLLLEVSQLLLAGGRLGAIADVVPDERFEPDAGFDPDVDGLAGLAGEPARADRRVRRALRPVRRASPRSSPAGSPTTSPTSMSDLLHGLQHYRAGRSPRRCGGGSSPTCRTGARTASLGAAGAALGRRRTCASTPRSTTTIRVEDRLLAETVARGHRRAVLTGRVRSGSRAASGRCRVPRQACAHGEVTAVRSAA